MSRAQIILVTIAAMVPLAALGIWEKEITEALFPGARGKSTYMLFSGIVASIVMILFLSAMRAAVRQ